MNIKPKLTLTPQCPKEIKIRILPEIKTNSRTNYFHSINNEDDWEYVGNGGFKRRNHRCD